MTFANTLKDSKGKDEANFPEIFVEMDATIRSQMAFVFFCISSFIMLIIYLGKIFRSIGILAKSRRTIKITKYLKLE